MADSPNFKIQPQTQGAIPLAEPPPPPKPASEKVMALAESVVDVVISTGSLEQVIPMMGKAAFDKEQASRQIRSLVERAKDGHEAQSALYHAAVRKLSSDQVKNEKIKGLLETLKVEAIQKCLRAEQFINQIKNVKQ